MDKGIVLRMILPPPEPVFQQKSFAEKYYKLIIFYQKIIQNIKLYERLFYENFI